MPKLFLTHLNKPSTDLRRVTHRIRSLANSIAGILETRKENPNWEQSLSELWHDDQDLGFVISNIQNPDSALDFFRWALRRPFADPPSSAAYSALLVLLAKHRRFQDVKFVLGTMEKEGKMPALKELGVLVGAYARAGMEEEAMDIFKRFKRESGSVPDVRDWNCLLSLLVGRRRFEFAREVYDEMVKREGGADNYSTLLILKALRDVGRLDEAKRLIEDRWGTSCIPSVMFYNMIIDGYCRNGDVWKGLELFKEMELKGFLPTLVSYGIIINGFCKKGHLVEVRKVLSEMEARGVQPNTEIYNTIIGVQCKNKKFRDAKVVFSKMVRRGCEPDVVTYNSFISAFCKSGKSGEAEFLLRTAIGRGVAPNERSYTPLIHGYCQEGKIALAMDLLLEMIGRGCKPDLVTYGALVHGLVFVGKIQEALVIREKLIERGVIPDTTIYNVLVSGLCKKGMLPAAKELLTEMLDHNGHPDEFIYTTLIDGFIRNGDLDEAKRIFGFMEQKHIKPGIVCYNAIIKGYCKFGLMNDAVACIKSMSSNGFKPDEFTYTTIIDGYVKQNDLDGAHRTLDCMLQQICKPNVVTYTALMNGFCCKGDLTRAEKIFKQMELQGIAPNVVTYSILIRTSCMEYDIEKAANYFEQMLTKQCSPNTVTFNYMFNGLVNTMSNAAFLSETEVQENCGPMILYIFRRMLLDGWEHRSAAYNAIMFCLCKYKMLPKAFELRDKMAENGYLPDSVTYLSLLCGICAEGRISDWKHILPCSLQQNELEIALKYLRLLRNYIDQSISYEVLRVLQFSIEEKFVTRFSPLDLASC